MNRAVLLVSLVLCALVQAVVPPWTAMGQAKPPVLLGGVLYYALTRNNSLVIEAAVVAGLLQDSLGPIPLGYSVVAFLSVALLTNRFRERVFGEHWVTHVLLGIASAVLVTFMMHLLLVGSGMRTGVRPSFVLSKALGASLLGMFAIPVVFKLIERLDWLLGNVDLREI